MRIIESHYQFIAILVWLISLVWLDNVEKLKISLKSMPGKLDCIIWEAVLAGQLWLSFSLPASCKQLLLLDASEQAEQGKFSQEFFTSCMDFSSEIFFTMI